ncbi:MAG: response regulator [Thermoanaerobaculales bacterium]|jgi:DNA-binding NtrC family response regulator|nr:response regulator [Thermoanaerobaculales bacterium]
MAIKVLLVDDETSFVETLKRRLTLRRLEVLTAASAAEALALLSEQEPDVVVLDVRMPGMSGIEATREIRRTHPTVEVILLTGHASLEASMEGMTMGAFDYLLKPVSIDELIFKIEDAHRRRNLRRAGTEGEPGGPDGHGGGGG